MSKITEELLEIENTAEIEDIQDIEKAEQILDSVEHNHNRTHSQNINENYNSNLADEEKKHHPQKKLRFILSSIKRTLQDNEDLHKTIEKINYTLWQDKEFGGSFIELGRVSDHIEFIDESGAIGIINIKRATKINAKANFEMYLNRLISGEIIMDARKENIYEPFKTAKEILKIIKENNIKFSISESLELDWQQAKSKTKSSNQEKSTKKPKL